MYRRNKRVPTLLQLTSIVENKPFKFETQLVLRSEKVYNAADLPKEFKVSPESLLRLAAKVVDALPLPDVYQWTSEDVCKWLERCGYKKYEENFRLNMISGRKLLLIDANALCEMNIKDFNDIKRITADIRKLFSFERTNFMRSISLPPQHHYELYNLFRTKSGYEGLKRSDLWCKMQMLRERSKYLRHWEVFERWLLRERETKYPELFGALIKYDLCK